MTQLAYWPDAWPPTDVSPLTARSLLRKMFLEYADAVHAKAVGKQPGRHIEPARTLANGVHDLLVDAQPQMASMGCDVTPLLSA